MIRTGIAMACVVIVAAAPLATSLCAGSCEAAHHVAAPTARAAARTCHHPGSPAACVPQDLGPCGHDHRDVVGVVAANLSIALRAGLSPVGGATNGYPAALIRPHTAAGPSARGLGPPASPPISSGPLVLSSS